MFDLKNVKQVNFRKIKTKNMYRLLDSYLD